MRLAREINFTYNVREELYKEWGYKIPDLLLHEELSGSKWYICDKYFGTNTSYESPKYIKVSDVKDFIKEATSRFAWIF